MRILIVEDDFSLSALLKRGLSESGHNDHIVICATLEAAMNSLTDPEPYDVALVDLKLPDAEGSAAPLKIVEKSPETAVIVFTGTRTSTLAASLLRRGVQDYFVKGESRFGEIKRGIQHALNRHQAAQELKRAATIDELTGALNRHGVEHEINAARDQAERTHKPFGIIYIDVDNMKAINDSLGHAAGDDALRIVAKRLRAAVRPQDCVARIGGDEFMVIVNNLGHADDAELVKDKLLRLFDSLATLNGNQQYLRCSMGAAAYHPGSETIEMAMQRADESMYAHKRASRMKHLQADKQHIGETTD